MKHKTFFLLLLMLTTTPWLAAQHAVWWDGSPPPGNTTRDHSIGYGNGFAWQVALGTAQSDDVAHDAIAISSGGYLVVGSNYYFNQEWFITHCDLALYRLDEEGLLVWEKLYAIDNYKDMNEFKVVEKPDGGFLVAGKLSYGGVGIPRRCILLNCDAQGDTLSTRKWTFADMATDDFKLIKSSFDESYFISYQRNYSGSYLTDVVKLDYNLDTLSISVLPHYRFVPKPFGFIYRGASYESVFYYYLSNQQGVVLDSFPDPLGQYTNHGLYPILSISPQRNGFFRVTSQGSPTIYKMAVTNNDGEVLTMNTHCFSSDDLFWLNRISGSSRPTPFSDGGFLLGFNWYLDYYDSHCIGLAKISSVGELTGDTILTRYGDTWLIKTLEGNDGKPLIFGYGENGPLGGPTFGEDILLAKLDSWNPVSAQTIEANGTLPLRVYPNPVGQTVTVELPQGVKGTLTVTSVNGIRLKSQNVNGCQPLTLNTSQWPKGQVVVSLHTPNGVYSAKLIKN